MSDQPNIVEETWVTAAEGAEKTGYHLDHVRRLARENLRLPEAERFMRVRKDWHGFTIWLPDLMNYFTRKMDFVKNNSDQEAEEIWVNTREAAEITGYSRKALQIMATKLWQQPEEARPVKMRKRSNGYDIWLPDLASYIEETGRGPYVKTPSK